MEKTNRPATWCGASYWCSSSPIYVTYGKCIFSQSRRFRQRRVADKGVVIRCEMSDDLHQSGFQQHVHLAVKTTRRPYLPAQRSETQKGSKPNGTYLRHILNKKQHLICKVKSRLSVRKNHFNCISLPTAEVKVSAQNKTIPN